MLRITVELVPHGDENLAKPISSMLIANVGGDAQGLATYVGVYDVGTQNPAVKTTTHYRRDNVWSLIRNLLISHDYGTPQGDDYCDYVSTVLIDNLPIYTKETV